MTDRSDDETPRDEHGERIPERGPRAGEGSLDDILVACAAMAEANQRHHAEQEAEVANHRSSCSLAECRTCGRTKCCRCGRAAEGTATCSSCVVLESLSRASTRVYDTIPARFKDVIDATALDLRKRVRPGGITEAAVAWADGLSLRPQNLVLTGPTGAGKTTLAVALLARWFRKHHDDSARFVSCIRLSLAPGQHPHGQGVAPLLEKSMNASLLVLDDVGSESTRYAEVIQSVMHARYDADLPTWITTGLEQPAIASRYDGGIARRMFEEAKLVKLGEVAT